MQCRGGIELKQGFSGYVLSHGLFKELKGIILVFFRRRYIPLGLQLIVEDLGFKISGLRVGVEFGVQSFGFHVLG